MVNQEKWPIFRFKSAHPSNYRGTVFLPSRTIRNLKYDLSILPMLTKWPFLILKMIINTRHRAYPNDRLVMRPSEKFEAKAAGQKGSEAWSSHVENVFAPTTQASGFAAGRNREGYLDTLCILYCIPNTPLYAKQSQFKKL